VRHLSRAEALDVLQHRASIGRLAFIAGGHPMILPMNYAAGKDTIVFCTMPCTKLSAVGAGAEVVFEVLRSARIGWAMTIRESCLCRCAEFSSCLKLLFRSQSAV
jgi:nitroimidazol reductase NimA-like FMN-containing flavoprotein (pyridoxamine 5'-phosphate oxidase superfamily)